MNAMPEYIPTIGLEIHAHLKTRTKMFCDSLNDPDEKHPNQNVCPVCMGHPGTLPVINRQAVEHVLRVGLALGSKIPEWSKFDRKNYFYPDLPKGYQISQYDQPLASGGVLQFAISGEKSQIVRITRVHLEEDAGKLIHPEGADHSLVDYNRAGVPLMELVTEPDIHSGEEARLFAEELQLLFRYLGVSDADMEKGLMRLEANISVAKKNEGLGLRQSEGLSGRTGFSSEKPVLGTKVEVKNLNSFRALEEAINFEIERQTEHLESGKKIAQETRGWDDIKKITYSQRQKEEAHDYRYFPEPDLPPLYLGTKKKENAGIIFDLEKIKSTIPEVGKEKRERFREQIDPGLSEQQLDIIVSEPKSADYYENAASEAQRLDPKIFKIHTAPVLAAYFTNNLRGLMNEANVGFEDLKISPEHFAHFCVLVARGELSSRAAQDVLTQMFETGEDPETIVREKGLTQVSNETELEAFVSDVIKANEKAVADYRAGKLNALQFLVGQIMARSKGRANPKVIEEMLKRLLA